MLNFAIQARSKPRTLTLARPRREETLQFNIIGGIDCSSGIFISQVEKGSKAEGVGLKRADQILQINGKNVTSSTQAKVLSLLRTATHLSITVQTNLSSFKGINVSHCFFRPVFFFYNFTRNFKTQMQSRRKRLLLQRELANASSSQVSCPNRATVTNTITCATRGRAAGLR